MNVNPFSYLIEKLKSKVSKSGDTMTGTLEINAPSASDFNLGKANTSTGRFFIFASQDSYRARLQRGTLTADRNFTFPDASGTVALTSDIPAPQLTSNPKTGMAGGWYVVWDLSVSWATDVSLWVQVASGTHVYVWTQNTLVTLA